MISTLTSLIVVVVVLGLVLFLIERFLPIAPGFKIAVRVIVVVILILFLLAILGGSRIRLY